MSWAAIFIFWFDFTKCTIIIFFNQLTSPAPWNRNLFSESFFPVILRLARIPATATDAVPIWETNKQTNKKRRERKRKQAKKTTTNKHCLKAAVHIGFVLIWAIDFPKVGLSGFFFFVVVHYYFILLIQFFKRKLTICQNISHNWWVLRENINWYMDQKVFLISLKIMTKKKKCMPHQVQKLWDTIFSALS